jgi:hypothetical protein
MNLRDDQGMTRSNLTKDNSAEMWMRPNIDKDYYKDTRCIMGSDTRQVYVLDWKISSLQ